MKYSEIINEGRDAPLYHGTEGDFAVEILSVDSLQADTLQAKRRLHIIKSKNDVDATKIKGVSLSRNIAVAFDFGPVVFEIDQRRLSQTKKLIPFDFWSPPFDVPEPFISARNPISTAKTLQYGKYEYEEFCIGDINPLSRYLLAIHVTSESLEHISQVFSWDCIRSHPLLKVNGKFINKAVLNEI